MQVPACCVPAWLSRYAYMAMAWDIGFKDLLSNDKHMSNAM